MDHSHRNRMLRRALRTRMRRRVAPLLLAAAVSLGLAACGGSDQAAKLLRQTFSGSHRVTSGNLALVLTVTPAGASGLKGPITLSVSGPFQSVGVGKFPASDFTIALGATGTTAAIAITSTGSSGYITYQGQSYKLPQATFERLESTFARLGSLSAGSTTSGALARLGIHPQRWLVSPQIVGNEAINGTNTTRIRAGLNMTALLKDLNTFLQRAASAGAAGARGLLPAATRRQIATEVKNPVVDIWTGVADKTLRQLSLDLGVPVSGQLSLLLGRSAGISLTLQYANLNQPQTITAPTKLLPYSVFQAKLKVLLQDFEGQFLTGGSGTSGGGGATGTSSSSSGPDYQLYTNCIQAAAGDLGKIQKCAPLLNGK